METYELNNPPEDERSRELWIQHITGFIIFKDIRDYAINKIPEETDDLTRDKIIRGIDDAIYGLMMVLDGVSGSLHNKEYSVELENYVKLLKNGEEIYRLNLFHVDCMCMGYHGWKEGDFGEDPIINGVSKED